MLYGKDKGTMVPGSTLDGIPQEALDSAIDFLEGGDMWGYVSNCAFVFENEDGVIIRDDEIVRECHSFISRWSEGSIHLRADGGDFGEDDDAYEGRSYTDETYQVCAPYIIASEVPVARLFSDPDDSYGHPLRNSGEGCDRIAFEVLGEWDDYVPFYQWFVHDSPYAYLFLNNQLGWTVWDTMNKGILIDARHVPVQVIAGLCVQARQAIERGNSPFLAWNAMVNAGVHPNFALAASFGSTIKDCIDPFTSNHEYAGDSGHAMLCMVEDQEGIDSLTLYVLGPNYNELVMGQTQTYRGYGMWYWPRGSNEWYSNPSPMLSALINPETSGEARPSQLLRQAFEEQKEAYQNITYMFNELLSAIEEDEAESSEDTLRIKTVMSNLDKLAAAIPCKKEIEHV